MRLYFLKRKKRSYEEQLQSNSEHQSAARLVENNIVEPEHCVIYKITGEYFHLELSLVTEYAQKSKSKEDSRYMIHETHQQQISATISLIQHNIMASILKPQKERLIHSND